MISISYAYAPVTSENSISSRVASDPTAICGASDGHEIPAGLIGGRNGRAPAAPEEAETDVTRDGDAAVGESGEDPAHPTTSTLASVSNVNDDFIRHLSLRPDEAMFWLVCEQKRVPLNLRGFRQRVDVQSASRQNNG